MCFIKEKSYEKGDEQIVGRKTGNELSKLELTELTGWSNHLNPTQKQNHFPLSTGILKAKSLGLSIFKINIPISKK